MCDEMKKVGIGCEGIQCDKSEDIYQFTQNFMSENAPGCLLFNVTAVAEDCFL